MKLSIRFLPDTLALRITGDAIAWTGLGIAIWARIALGSNWSGLPTFREGHELIQRGPYRFVRHPIYTGVLLMMLGSAILLGRGWSFVS